MSRIRVQALVVQDGGVLFGFGKGVHFFPGGGLETGETPEQGALRELKEETNVEGNVIFRLSQDIFPDTVTFLVDIWHQVPTLGYDPEETDTGDRISLAGIEMIPLERFGSFTQIDIDYFKVLVNECQTRNAAFPWLGKMKNLITQWRQE